MQHIQDYHDFSRQKKASAEPNWVNLKVAKLKNMQTLHFLAEPIIFGSRHDPKIVDIKDAHV